MKKYAVLISGAKAESGYDEFWNDLVLMRQALINNGFLSKNIFVLYGDGQDYNDPTRPLYCQNPVITTYKADTTHIKQVFNGFAQGINGMPQLTDLDMLFIWTFDHGDVDSTGEHSLLGLMNDDYMDDTTFAGLVNQVPHANRIICMQQCFSGGFIAELKSPKTVVLTACRKSEFANRCDDSAVVENETFGNVTYHHGEFTYHLLSAITGSTIAGTPVNADDDSNGIVTIDEVFNYIRMNDSCEEHPKYKDDNHIGQNLSLK